MNRKEEAVKAKNCNDWRHICNAECCKQFRMNGITKSLEFKDGKFMIQIRLTPDLIKYYKLHGVGYKDGYAIIDPMDFKMSSVPGHDIIIFERPCDWLTEDGLCSEHDSGKKPHICKVFDETKRKGRAGMYASKNCLANYKG